jgi:hypothetical protein
MNEIEEEEWRLATKELLDAVNELRELHGESPLLQFPKRPFCSFCGKTKDEVGSLAEGAGAHICLACATEAARLLKSS